MKFITPIILIIVSVTSFLMFTNPTYKEVKELKAKATAYNEALATSARLQAERDALTAKYNSLLPEDLKRLTQLLPDTTDNVRLIIDLQRMAQAYGMTISSTKFDAKSTKKTVTPPTGSPLQAVGANDVAQATRDYGVFELAFSTTGNYENFMKFLKDVESSLRLTDIQSVEFSSDQAVQQQASNTSPVGISVGNSGTAGYIYTVKLRTYWLKG
jgi:Tfp pilus assembly protein PilO